MKTTQGKLKKKKAEKWDVWAHSPQKYCKETNLLIKMLPNILARITEVTEKPKNKVL